MKRIILVLLVLLLLPVAAFARDIEIHIIPKVYVSRGVSELFEEHPSYVLSDIWDEDGSTVYSAPEIEGYKVIETYLNGALSQEAKNYVTINHNEYTDNNAQIVFVYKKSKTQTTPAEDTSNNNQSQDNVEQDNNNQNDDLNNNQNENNNEDNNEDDDNSDNNNINNQELDQQNNVDELDQQNNIDEQESNNSSAENNSTDIQVSGENNTTSKENEPVNTQGIEHVDTQDNTPVIESQPNNNEVVNSADELDKTLNDLLTLINTSPTFDAVEVTEEVVLNNEHTETSVSKTTNTVAENSSETKTSSRPKSKESSVEKYEIKVSYLDVHGNTLAEAEIFKVREGKPVFYEVKQIKDYICVSRPVYYEYPDKDKSVMFMYVMESELDGRMNVELPFEHDYFKLIKKKVK